MNECCLLLYVNKFGGGSKENRYYFNPWASLSQWAPYSI